MQDVQLNDISRLFLRDSPCNLRKKLAICNLQFSGKERHLSQKWQNRQNPIAIWSNPYWTHHGWSSGRLSLAAKQGWRVTLEWGLSERALSGTGRPEGPAGRLDGSCRGVPRRDTAAEAAGTGGVGTAGALAKNWALQWAITRERMIWMYIV